jgi:hypothetical protein
MFKCDGNVCKVSIEELKVGMVLRPIQSDGSVAPFTDVVITYVARHEDDPALTSFDVVRPYAFAHLGGELHSVETVRFLRKSSLDRYRLVTLASGKPYMMHLGH